MRGARGNRPGVAVVVGLLVMGGVVFGAGSATAATSTEVAISPDSTTVQTGSTTTVEVIVPSASGGVGAYSASIELSNPDTAAISDIRVSGNPDEKDVSISENGGSATIDAALMNTDNTGTVTIATVTLEGTSSGTTDIYLKVSALGDETGNSYTVTGTVDGSLSVESSNNPPSPAMVYSPQNAAVGENIVFDASVSNDSDGTIQKYAWDFEDNGDTDAIGQQVTHAFQTGGDHVVALTVTDDGGASATTRRTISIPHQPTTTTRATTTPLPTEETTDEPTDETTGELTDEPTDETTGELTDEPTDETTGEATQETTEQLIGETTQQVPEEMTTMPTPGFGVAVSLIALLGTALIALRRGINEQ